MDSWEGGGRSSPASPQSTPNAHTNSTSPPSTLTFSMAYFNDNANYYHMNYDAGNPYVHPERNLTPAAEAASIQTFDTLANYWDWAKQPVPMVAPLTNSITQNNNSKYRVHLLVNWCLIRGLQVRWLQPPRISPRETATASHRTHTNTPANICHKLKINPNIPYIAPSPPGRSLKHALLPSQPPAVVSTSLFRTSKKSNAHRPWTDPFGYCGDNQNGLDAFYQVSLPSQSPSHSPIDTFNSRMCTHLANLGLVQPELRRVRRGGSTHTEPTVLAKPNTPSRI
jgi:hypothetical protein